MMTVKSLMTTPIQASPDGVHWEPALPMPPMGWLARFVDAWAVWKGEAVAVRQTTKRDLEKQS